MPIPSHDELTALAQQLGMSRGDLEAFVEAWNRAGQKEPLTEFLGIKDTGPQGDSGSLTA